MNKTLVALLGMLPLASHAQDAGELRRQLKEKEAEVQRLRERIARLEPGSSPQRFDPGAEPAADDELDPDSERALERALVRERGLLLSPRRVEIEPNFAYSYFDTQGGSLKRQAYGPGLSLRLGLPARFQFEAGIPYVWERRDSAGTKTRASGTGDGYVALSRQLLLEGRGRPGVIASLGYQFANGRNTIFGSGTPVALGSGFDTISAGLTFIKRADPLVFFGSYSFAHGFSEDRSGVRIDPGQSHALRLGTALATSPGTSLRAAFSMRFFDKIRAGGTPVPGSGDPAGVLELGGSATLNASSAIDVLLGIGVTRNAPDFRIGIALPIRF